MKNDSDLGKYLRKVRESKKITINEIAKKTGFTPSFISQFERGLTKASISSLQKIVQALNMSLSELFIHTNSTTKNEAKHSDKPNLVRKENRSKLSYPDNKSFDYLLTGIHGQFEMILSEIEPGGGSGELVSHNDSEEGITVLQGMMEITIGSKKYTLYQGDTITFPSHIPHGWKNIGDELLKLIWIVSPPTY